MTKNPDQSENVPLKSLETRLRNLPRFSAPATLKARVLRSIPESGSSSESAGAGIFVRKTWAGAAAVIFVCTVALVINYGSSLLPNRLTTEVNIASTGPNTVDHNNTHIMDTNRAGLVNR